MDKIPQNIIYTYYFDTTILTVRLTPYAISIKLAFLVSVYSHLKPFLWESTKASAGEPGILMVTKSFLEK